MPWKKFRRQVFRLQRGIFKAEKLGQIHRVKRLQRLLLRSKAAKFLAVRQVTQLNLGKKTAGVDGKTALTTKERFQTFHNLHKNWDKWNHRPLRRVNIPKPDGRVRGLGIPTIADRAWQCLLKYVAEPCHEATAGARSYGFRPGRGAHDCQKLLFNNLNSFCNGFNKRVYEADIEKCFDRISHKAILDGVVLPKEAKKGLAKAIRAGVRGETPSSIEGTPQGGTISPKKSKHCPKWVRRCNAQD